MRECGSANACSVMESREKTTSKRRGIGFTLLFFGLLGLTAYFLLSGGFDIRKGISVIGEADPIWLLAAVLAMSAFLAWEGLCMKVLTKALGYGTNFFQCYKYAFIDFYFSAVTPGACGGQPAQACYMKRDGLPLGASSLCLLTFNMIYHLVVPILAAGAFLCLWISDNGFINQFSAMRYLIIFGVVVQMGLALLYLLVMLQGNRVEGLLIGIINLLSRKGIVRNGSAKKESVKIQLAEYRRGAKFLKANPLTCLKVVFFTALHLLTLYTVPFWVYRALGFGTLGFVQILAIQILLTLAVESLPLPGGIGAAEGGFLAVYAAVFPGGALVGAMLLCRCINYYLFVIAGGAVAAIDTLRRVRPVKPDPCHNSLSPCPSRK